MPLPLAVSQRWDTVSAHVLEAARPSLQVFEHACPATDPVHPQAVISARTVHEPGVSGRVVVHREFPSTILRNTRDLWVYLPPGYDENPTRSYPTLYMHDGQNLFSPSAAFGGAEWGIDETAERLIANGMLAPLIIVGIANTGDRLDEYTWAPDPDGEEVGGHGEHYAQFLVQEVRPYIQAVYRTAEGRHNTAVAGSSLGGLISLYLANHMSHVFGKVGAMSPSVWWGSRRALYDLSELPRDLQIWLDIGSREGEEDDWAANVVNTRDLYELLVERGYEAGDNLLYWEDEGADHSEAAWRNRAALMLHYFFDPPKPHTAPGQSGQ